MNTDSAGSWLRETKTLVVMSFCEQILRVRRRRNASDDEAALPQLLMMPSVHNGQYCFREKEQGRQMGLSNTESLDYITERLNGVALGVNTYSHRVQCLE